MSVAPLNQAVARGKEEKLEAVLSLHHRDTRRFMVSP